MDHARHIFAAENVRRREGLTSPPGVDGEGGDGWAAGVASGEARRRVLHGLQLPGQSAPEHRWASVSVRRWRSGESVALEAQAQLLVLAGPAAPLLSAPACHSAEMGLSQATHCTIRSSSRPLSSPPSALSDIRCLTAASFRKLFSLALVTSNFPGFPPILCPQAFSPGLPTHMPNGQANACPQSDYSSPIPCLSPLLNICARSRDLMAVESGIYFLCHSSSVSFPQSCQNALI